MAFIHEGSCECAKSELDLFSVPATQTSVESGTYVEYHPISSMMGGSDIFVNENKNENENYKPVVHENENENDNYFKN